MVTERYGQHMVGGRVHSDDLWTTEEEEAAFGVYICPRIQTPKKVLISFGRQRHHYDSVVDDFVRFLHGALLAEQGPRLGAPLTHLAEHYVELVKKVPEVHEIWLSVEAEEPTIWTIISAPRLDKASRARIYETQIEILRMPDRPLVDFRLINLNELSEPDFEFVPPVGSRILWTR